MTEVYWPRLKAQEVRALADQNAVVILPVASIEQHGPHLPTMTDTRLGEEIALRAARKAFPTRPTIVAPVVWSGLSEHHMPFGGTLTISHATFRALIRDLIDAMVRLGFRDILISNSHGGNIVALNQILDEISRETEAVLVNVTYAMEAGPEIAEILEDQPSLMHAGEGETSMMMVAEAALVDSSELDSLGTMEAKGPDFLKAGKTGYRWRLFTHLTGDGIAGLPAKSTPEKGERLFAVSVDALVAIITDPETWAAPRDLRGAGTGGVPFRKDG